jgi:Flp pilus assembly protein TadG
VNDVRLSTQKSQTGVALVEFAIMVPLLSMLLVGVIEIGRFAYFSIAVGNAAHAGVQYGSYNARTAADFAGMQAAATSDGQNNIQNITAVARDVCSCWIDSTGTESPSPPTAAACSANPRCTSGTPVTYAQVTASGTYSPMMHYPGLPTTFGVSATATMRVGMQP